MAWQCTSRPSTIPGHNAPGAWSTASRKGDLHYLTILLVLSSVLGDIPRSARSMNRPAKGTLTVVTLPLARPGMIFGARYRSLVKSSGLTFPQREARGSSRDVAQQPATHDNRLSTRRRRFTLDFRRKISSFNHSSAQSFLQDQCRAQLFRVQLKKELAICSAYQQTIAIAYCG